MARSFSVDVVNAQNLECAGRKGSHSESYKEAGVHDLRQAIREDHLRRLCRQAPRRSPGQKKEGPENQGI